MAPCDLAPTQQKWRLTSGELVVLDREDDWPIAQREILVKGGREGGRGEGEETDNVSR